MLNSNALVSIILLLMILLVRFEIKKHLDVLHKIIALQQQEITSLRNLVKQDMEAQQKLNKRVIQPLVSEFNTLSEILKHNCNKDS